MTKVSIIIPTYKDWGRLSLCLSALSEQSYDRSFFEIIVVNNAIDDKVSASYSVPDNCIVIDEPKAGSYAARNAGLEIAKGEIVGFTDSDCIPDRGWIKSAVEIFEKDKNISRLAGAIKIFSRHEKPSTVELYDFIYAFWQEINVKNGYAVTANLFTYKSLFNDVGYFNGETMSGGDFEWGKRAHQGGYNIQYSENVIVNHPARGSLRELLKKAKRVGKGQGVLLKGKDTTWEATVEILKILKPRTWEVSRIFEKGKDFSFLDKVTLVALRHFILWTSDFYRITTQMKKVQK